MVNPYTDPRYAMARMMASKPASSAFSPTDGTRISAPSEAAVRLGRAANDLALGNPGMQERLRRIAEGGSGQSPRGFVGTVLGNPITKGAFNALNIVSAGGRAVVAGLDEASKALDYDPNTKASASNFVKNVKDPEYGFGKAFNPNTGSIWLDRAIGFVGDVALDPLTYATFGVGKFAGYGGRLDLANAVGKVTNDAGLVNRVQRFGRTAPGMTPEILEAVGANRYGLHFLGKRIKVGQFDQGLRLPGSGSLGYLSERGLARARVMFTDSKAGQLLQKVSLPGEFIEARRALSAGKLSDDTASALVSFFNADPVQRIEAGRVFQEQRQRLTELFEREKANGLDGYKNSLVNLLEDDAAFQAASPELQRAATIYKNIFSEFEDAVLQGLKAVDETIDPSARFRQNYFPRIVTDRGLNLLSDPTNPYGSALRTIFGRDPLSGGGNFKARMLEPGDVFFGKTLDKADLASTTKLNEIARKAGFGGDFFETDITKVLERYVSEFSKEMGVLAKHKHLVDTGFWKRVQDLKVDGQFVDDELVSALKKRVGTLDNDMARSAKTTAEALRSLEGAIKEAKLKLGKEVGEAEKALKELESFDGIVRTADEILNQGIDLSDAALQQVVDQMGTLKKNFANMLGLKLSRSGKIIIPEAVEESSVPVMSESIISVLSRVEASVNLVKSNLELARSGKEGADLQKAADDIAKEIKRIEAEVVSARTTMQNTIQYGQILNDGLEKAIAGDVSDLAINQLYDIGVLMSPGVGADTVAETIQKVFGSNTGVAQDYLRAWLNEPNGVFARLTVNSPAPLKDTVAKMSKADFEDIVQRAFDSKADPNELRAAAFYALGMDARMYGDEMPEAIALLRTELESSLDDLDIALRYDLEQGAAAARGERRTASTIFDTQVRDAYARVSDAINDLNSLNNLQGEDFYITMKQVLADNPDAAETVLPIERIEPFFDKYPVLRDLFETDPIDEIRALMNEDAYVYASREAVPAPVVRDELTLGGFVDSIDNMVKTKSGILNEKAYSFGSGVSERTYTGLELKARFDEYTTLVDESKKVRNIRRAFAEDFYAETDGPLLELEVKALIDSGVEESDSSVVALRRRIKAFSEQANTRASLSEYDDFLALELERVGYFREKDSIRRAALRGQAEDAYFEMKKRRVRNTVKGKTKAGRFSIGDKETELNNAIREISGGGGMVRPEGFNGLDAAKAKFADNLMQYTIVSEVHTRYNAVTQILAGFNQAPTERMVKGILDVVAQKHIPRVSSKIESYRRAEVILKKLDIDVANAIRSGNGSPNAAFVSALNALTESERAILREAVGREMSWTTDPRDLVANRVKFLKDKNPKSPGPQLNPDGSIRRDVNGKPLQLPSDRTNAQNIYYREHVEPWFRAAYPNEAYSKKAADDKLKLLRKSSVSRDGKAVVSPFSEDVSPSGIKRWFESIVGQSEIAGRRDTTLGIPKLQREVRNLQKVERRLVTLLSPDLNVGRWMDDPSSIQRTATWYAHLMEGTAKRLQDAVNAHNRKFASVIEGQQDVVKLSSQAQAGDAEIARVVELVKNIETYGAEIEKIQTSIARVNKEIETAVEKTFLNAEKKTLQSQLSEAKRNLVAAQQAPKRLRQLEEKAVKKIPAFKKASAKVDVDIQKLAKVEEQIRILELKKGSLSGEQKARLSKLKGSLPALESNVKNSLDALNKINFTPAERDLISKARVDASVTEMARLNNEYTELLGNAQYVQAVADLEINNALNVLADYDLEDFTNGFLIDEVVTPDSVGGMNRLKTYVSMPNGERLTFSRAESLSLFKSQINRSDLDLERFASTERGFVVRSEQLQDRLAAVDEEVKSVQQWVDGAQSRVNDNLRLIEAPRALGESTEQVRLRRANAVKENNRLQAQIQREQARLGSLADLRFRTENELVEVNNMVQELRDVVASNSSEVLASALAKVKILVEGTVNPTTGERVPGVLGPDGLSAWRDKTSKTRINAPEATVDEATASMRRGHLNTAWKDNPSSDFIRTADKLRNNIFVQTMETMRNDVDGLRAKELHMQTIVDGRVHEAERLGEDIVNIRESAMNQARQADEATQARLGQPVGRTAEDGSFVESDLFGGVGVNNPLAAGDPAFITPESIRSFAADVNQQNAPSGPFVQPLSGAEARRAAATIRTSYEKRIETVEGELRSLIDNNAPKQTVTKKRNQLNKLKEEARQAISNTRTQKQLEYGVRQKEEAVARRVTMYNAAVESVEEWKKKNPGVIAQTEKALKEVQKDLDDVRAVVDKLRKVDEKTIARLDKTFGGTDAYWAKVADTKALIDDLNEQLRLVNSITAMPGEEARKVMMRLSGKKGTASAARADMAIKTYREWMDVNKPVFEQLAQDPDNPIAKAWANAAIEESNYIWNTYRNFGAVEQLMDASYPVWATRIIQPLSDEWEKAAKASGLYDNMSAGGTRKVDADTGADLSRGFPGLMGNTEALELLNRMSTLRTPGVVNDLARFMRGYTGFFRSYATLSPGFHVRNSIGNVFSLFAAGVDTSNMSRAFGVWKQIQSGVKSGRSVDEIIASMPSDQQEFARIGYRVMIGLGGGRTFDALEGFMREGNKITSNALLEASRKLGDTLEGASRFILAYDSAVKGMDEVTTFNRTGRFLVDYNKKTAIDETMRDIMPFWVWMSRNLPLQVVTRWTNPKPYLMYDKFSKNLQDRDSEGEVVPDYLKAMGAIGLGGGNFLSLDLPFSRVDEQIQGFASPKSFFGYVNPGIKAPIEFLTNTDTFRDRKFPDTYRKVDGALLPFLPLLKALGQVEYDGSGNAVTSERAYTTLINLIPPLSRAERLMPSDGGIGGQALRGTLGIPFTNVPEGARDAELYRRLAEVQRVGGFDAKAEEAR
jgi:hypothetical protein